jgi:hypothetical protein
MVSHVKAAKHQITQVVLLQARELITPALRSWVDSLPARLMLLGS